MIVGFMAMEWTTVPDKLGIKHQQIRSEILLTLLWDEIYGLIWKARCNIKHNTENFSTLNEIASLADKLMWYHQHQDEVLDYRHRFLVG